MIVYLVIKADRTVRVAKKPRLAADEVAIKVTLTFSPKWGSVIGDLEIAAPDLDPSYKYEEVGGEG